MKSSLLTLGLVFATVAVAAPQPAARSERVAYDDLNLASTAAQSTVQLRIRAAANRVCDLGGMQALNDFGASSNCFRKAVADGLRQMDRVVAAKRGGAVMAATALIITAK